MISVLIRELNMQLSWNKGVELIKDGLGGWVSFCLILFIQYGTKWNGVHLLLGGSMCIAYFLSRLSQNRGVTAFYLVPLNQEDKQILFRNRYLIRSLIPAGIYGIGAAVILFCASEAWVEVGYDMILLLLYSFCENLYVGGSVTTKSAENHDKIEEGKWETEEYELRTWLKEQIKKSKNWRKRRKNRKTESRWERTLRRMELWQGGILVAVMLGWQPFLLEKGGINGIHAGNMTEFWQKSSDVQQYFIVARAFLSVLLFTAYLTCFYKVVKELAGNYEEILERSAE